MKKQRNFPRYRQELGDGKIRIVTLINFGKHQVTAACREFKEGIEYDLDALYYSKVFRRTPTPEGKSFNELLQMAKDFFNITEEQLIKTENPEE